MGYILSHTVYRLMNDVFSFTERRRQAKPGMSVGYPLERVDVTHYFTGSVEAPTPGHGDKG